MRLIALVLALVSLDAGIAATTGGAATSVATSVSIPALGTVAWAEAVEKARDDFDHAANSTDLVQGHRRLLALYHGCTRCRTQAYQSLEYKLKALPADSTTMMLAQEVESANDPVSFGRLLVQTGRASQAKQIVTTELHRTQFPEHRLRLLEVLAEAEGKLGNLTHQRQIARRLLKDAPISENYCDKALVWMSWLGEEPLPNEDFIDLKGFPQTFNRLRELETRRGNDAYVSCRVYHALDLWDRTVRGLKNVQVRVDDAVLSLFPNGIGGPLQDLARRTSDEKVHAALLLAAAFHTQEIGLARRLLLIREAKAVSDLPSIQIGAWRSDFVYIFERKDECEALALNMIERYPRSEASCEGCVQYWNALNYPYPQLPTNRIQDWRDKCLSVIQHCPDQVDLWLGMSTTSSDPQRSRDMCQAILDMAPPSEVVPTVLLRLSELLRAKDPKRAWEIERAAIEHTEYPGVAHEVEKYSERQHRAEINGDFGTALYLELLSPHYRIMSGCIPGDRSLEIGREFRRAYLRLRLGGDPKAGWSKLLGLLPATPEDASSHGLLQPEYLDRLLEAALATREEPSALDWMRAVRQRFQGDPSKPASWGNYGWSEPSASHAEAMLDGYIRRLENAVHP